MHDNEELLERVYGVERDHPCVHGHFDCAEYEGGPCAPETYAKLLAEKDEAILRSLERGE
jgi:hypothetical protein